MSGGTLPPVRLQQLPRGAGRALLDELQLEQRRLLDDLLGARDVGDARQLHQNLIAAPPCGATIGSATPSSLTRRSMVCIAWSTAPARALLAMFGFIRKTYVPPRPTRD